MEQTEVAALAEGTDAPRPDLFRADQIRMTAATGSGAAAVIRLRQRTSPARREAPGVAGLLSAPAPAPAPVQGSGPERGSLPQIGVPGQHADVLFGGDVDPATGRLLTVAELMARFEARSSDPWSPETGPEAGRPASWMAVVSAQPGAGCSTLSGALGAIDQDGDDTTAILDAGAGWAFDWRWHAQRPPSAIVITCRASVPGVIETERLLTYLDTQPGMTGAIMLVAALGTVEWPRAVGMACGPLLAATRAAGCVVAVPYVRALNCGGPAIPDMVAELTGPAAVSANAVLPEGLVTAAEKIWALAVAQQHAS